MAKQTIDFAKLIQQDRERRQQQHWQGSFIEYLDKVKEDASLANLSHRRLHDMIDTAGLTEINPESDPRVQRLFGEAFGPANVEMTVHGNVLAGTAFLQGIAAEELEPAELEAKDALYPLLITVRAVKARDANRGGALP